MLIVAVAWIYVVLLMAFTEPTVVAGIMTLLLYCVLPLGILFYLTGSGRRKRKRAAQENPQQKLGSDPEGSVPPESD
jgi:ABC-type transport system involved in cytochrome bd biosynthesis fused ATPase/permease subunit